MKFQQTPLEPRMVLLALILVLVGSVTPSCLQARSQVSKPKITKPKITKPSKQAVTRSYASKLQPAIIASTKSVGSKWTSSIKVDLGSAFVSRSTQRVENATGVTFSQVSWAKLTETNLPSGAAITNIGRPGEPAIPYLSFAVAVPAGATGLTTKHTVVRRSSIGNVLLLPLAKQIDDTSSTRTYDKALYRSTSVQPIKTVGPGRMRQLTMVQVMVPLVDFDPGGPSEALESFTVDLQYSAPSANRVAFADQHFLGVYQNLVLNSADIPRFAAPFTSPLKASQTQTFDQSIISWIDRAAPYIKLSVKRDGLYRLTAAELSASTIDISNWDADQVRLIDRGVEVPMWVEKDGNGKIAAIEFYGERLRGMGTEYFNVETDVHAYWLTTSGKTGGEPKRYGLRDLPLAARSVDEGIVTLHHERDYDHYEGKDRRDDQETIFRTQWVTGERWIWKRLGAQQSLKDTFMVSGLPADPALRTIDVSYEVHGISFDETISDNHRIQVKLNDQVIDEQLFNAYDSLGRSVTVSAGLLREGANALEILSLGTGSTLDVVYVDNYRVRMPVRITANRDTAIARDQVDLTITGQSTSFNISPNTALASLYNLTAGVRLQGEASGSATVYPEEPVAQARYVGATSQGYLKPSKIEAWNKDGKGWSILDELNGADYIVLTHPSFNDNSTGAQANKLKARREFAGLRSKVVTTEEVFNAFAFGSDESWSIRRFIDYAYHTYAGTPPAFVTLFGDGTWDPKVNRTIPELTSDPITTHRTLVPTYGKPASDFIFTTVDGEGIDSLFPEVVISRIPAETVEDAEAFVTKLIEYESRPPEAWNREFLFVIGGDGPPDKFEHYRFLEEVTIYTELPPGHSNYQGGLRFPPLNIVDTRVPRQVFHETDVTQVSRLQSEFREGKSLVHFAGHGATFITDVFFGDPGLYRNQGLYPLFITLSCRTGAFAEPWAITLNESFLRTRGGGVVMAFGTTGFGEATYDFTLSSYLFKMFTADSLFQDTTYDAKRLNIASMLTAAKVLASIASFGNLAENARLQYSVLGDAAMGFVFRPQPEFHIEASDVKIRTAGGEERTTFEADEEVFETDIVIHNFGYSALNPVTIRVSDESSILLEARDTLPFLHVTDTVTLRLPLDTNRLGQHTLRITVDPEQEYSESNESDNEVSLSFIVNGQAGRPVFPFIASRGMCGINGDSVVIVVQLPEKKYVTGRDRLEIEFDTTARFTDPLGRTANSGGFPTVTNSYLTSSLPRNYRNVVYWRTRTIISGTASNWSTSSFNIDKMDEPQLHLSTRDQLEAAIDVGLQVNAQDRLAIPQTDTVTYTVVSHGSADTTINSFSVSQIFRNDKPIYDLTHPKSGFALVVMTDDGNSIEQVHEFVGIPMDNVPEQTARAKQFDSIVRAIPDGRLVMVLTNFQPFVAPAFSRDTVYIRPALRSLGARIAFDSLDYFTSYAMIGRKGWTPGQAIEDQNAARTNGSEVSYQVVTLGTSGIATTPFTGVSSGYRRIRWTGPAMLDGAAIKFTVLGQRKDNNRIERLTSFQGASTYDQDISGVDANTYDQLAVEMEFSRNSSASASPELASIAIEYTPAPELELSLLTASETSVEEGKPVLATYVVRNVLCFPASNVDVQLLRTVQSRIDTFAKRTISIGGNAQMTFTDTVGTSGLNDVITITASVDPEKKLNEQFTNNNVRSVQVQVTRDTNRPRVDVVFDDRHISDRDFVAPDVEIRMQLFDSSPLRVTDSLSISGVLRYSKDLTNPITLTPTGSTVDYRINYKAYPNGDLQAELIVDPKTPLKPGEYTLTVYAQDASGNAADTVEIRFQVSATNGIQQVMNYPNPFTSSTDFTFILRGSGQGAGAKITIYTVSGKKIRTITPGGLRTGLNSVHWDGRDENGNEVANGTYLYRVSVNASNADGSDVEEGVTERAVKSK